MVGIWLAALTLVGTVSFAAIRAAPARHPAFAGAPVAVIGSSLMQGAFPPAGSGGDSVLGDGRSHRRIGLRLIEEWRTVALANQAVDQGAKVVLLEAYPFVRSFAQLPQESECDRQQVALRSGLKDLQLDVSDALHLAVGVQTLASRGDYEPLWLANRQQIDPEFIRLTYPLTFHQPHCRTQLDALVRRARTRGVQIVLVAPPHSQATQALVGYQMAEQRARTRQLAASLALPLFMPQGPWTNADFADQAHFNTAGRRHFMAAFRAWWRSR